MSKHRQQVRLVAELDTVVEAFDRAFAPLQHESPWQRVGGSAQTTVSEKLLSLSRLLNNPVTVEVDVEVRDLETVVTLSGQNFGWGPLQDGHVSGCVSDLAERLRREVGRGVTDSRRKVEAGSSPPRETRSNTRRKPGDWGSGRIFVSYRRDDTGYVTDAVCNRLAAVFGRDTIFKDIDSIPLGVDFRQYLTTAVQNCDVVLAIIGRDWLVPGNDGKPRLHDERDFVRIELEAALARRIPVIPVLVRIQQMPKEELLPDTLRGIVYFNGMPVRREPDFDSDLERLRNRLEQILGG